MIERTPARSTQPDQLALFTFEQLEAVIERGIQTFVEVGLALLRIRDERMYRQKGYADFDSYCRQRWGWTYQRAHQMMQGARVAELTSTMVDSAPTSERQARELVPLLDDEKALVEVWREVKETHGDKITAEKIREAVDIAVRRDQMMQARRWEPPPAITPQLPTGRYRCIVIDPPWPMEKIEREVHPDQGRALDYPTMDLDEIGGLPVPDLAEDGCHVYLWVTHKFLPVGLELLDTWGARYQCMMTWVKNVGFTPYSWMYSTEHVLFARIGALQLDQMGLRLDFAAPVTRHSAKPDVFYERVVQASPAPRLELFAREPRVGFDAWGNEVADATL